MTHTLMKGRRPRHADLGHAPAEVVGSDGCCGSEERARRAVLHALATDGVAELGV